MPRPTVWQLALFVATIVILVLISWQIFDRPLGRVLGSAVAGIVVGVALWRYLHRSGRAR